MAGAAADSLLVIGRIPQDATVRLGMVEAMLHDACDALPEIASIVLNRGFVVVAFEAPPPAAVLGERKLSVKLGGATEQVLVVLERVPRGEEPAAVAARLNSDGKASPRPRSARGKAGASLTALQIDSTSPRADEGEGGSTSRKKARLGASSAPLNAQLSPPETPLDTDGQPSKQVGGARLNRHGLSYRCSRCGQPKKGHNCGLDGGGTPPVLAQPLVIGGFSMMAGVAPMAAACYVPVQQLGAGAAQSVPFAYQLAAPPLGAQLSAGVARSARGAGGSSNAGATARGASAPPLGAPAIGELSEMDLMLADLAFAAVHASGKAAASAVPGAVGVGRPPPVVTPDDAILPGPLGGANDGSLSAVLAGLPSFAGRFSPGGLSPSLLTPSQFTPSQLMRLIASSPLVTPASGSEPGRGADHLAAILAGLTPSTLAHLGIGASRPPSAGGTPLPLGATSFAASGLGPNGKFSAETRKANGATTRGAGTPTANGVARPSPTRITRSHR